MQKFLDFIKLLFFVWTLLVAATVLRWEYIFGDKKELVLKVLFPGFRILLWMTLGAIVGEFVMLKNDLKPQDPQADKILLRSYVVGGLLWALVGGIYIYFYGSV